MLWGFLSCYRWLRGGTWVLAGIDAPSLAFYFWTRLRPSEDTSEMFEGAAGHGSIVEIRREMRD